MNTVENELTHVWDDIRQSLIRSAMSRMTIPQANEFSVSAVIQLGLHIRKLIDIESKKYLESVLRDRAKTSPDMTLGEFYEGQYKQEHDYRGQGL